MCTYVPSCTEGELEDNLWGFVSSFNCGEPQDPTQGRHVCAWHKEILPIEPSWWSPPLHYSCSRHSHSLRMWDHQPHPSEGMWRGRSSEGVGVVTDEGKRRTNRWKTEDTNAPNTVWYPGLNSQTKNNQRSSSYSRGCVPSGAWNWIGSHLPILCSSLATRMYDESFIPKEIKKAL